MLRLRPVSRGRSLLGALLLLAAVLLTFLRALDAGFVWDDDDYLTGNPAVQSPGELRRIWLEPRSSPQYYPLVFSSFWVEHRLWGMHPAGYHAVNILLHAGATVMLWLALARLRVPGAWLAALWFGLHPVQVESVAWITERKNVLSGFLYLASFLACLRAFRLDRQQGDAPVRDRVVGPASYVVALVLFAGALLAKSVTATLPLAVAVACWYRRRPVATLTLWLPLLPFLALGALSGALTTWLEANHVGARGDAWSLSPLERVLVAGRALWFYAGKLAWPADLAFVYPRWRVDSGDPSQWLPPLGAVALVLALWRMRARLGRGPLAAVLFFAVTLGPALSFVNVYPMRYSFVADHFQYLAGGGPLALFAAALTRAIALPRATPSKAAAAARCLEPRRPTATVLPLLLGLALALSSRQRCTAFRDSETLWRDTLAKNPSAWVAHNNLSVILARRGEIEEATRHVREALRLRPDLAEIRSNFGDALLIQGRTAAALEVYRQVVQLEPGLPESHVALGAALEKAGLAAEAERAFEEALRLDPRRTEARYRLARLSFRRGDTPRAAALLAELLGRTPPPARAYAMLGEVRTAEGQIDEAEPLFREAIRLEPRSPEGHLGLGVLLAARGDLGGAEASLARAAALAPDSAEARYNLGKVADLREATAEAVRYYRAAIGIAPGLAEAHNNLGIDLLLLGQVEQGRRHLREALRLQPGLREARVNLERSFAGR